MLMVGLDSKPGDTIGMEPWHMGWLLKNCSNSIADISTGLHVCLIALPVAAALLMIMQNNFQVAQKWASVHVAASRVVTEIYQFLAAVGPYNAGATINQKLFQKRLRTLARCSSASGMPEEDVMGGSEDEFAHDLSLLQRHVEQSLYGIGPHWQIMRRLGSCCGCCFASPATWGWASLLDVEQKDLTAPVTTETYVEMRMNPLRTHYTEMVRRLARTHKILYLLLLLFLGGSVLLGALGLPGWIPVTVSLAAVVGSLVQWVAPPEVFAALNSALSTLSSFDLKWQGTDIRESRSQATKELFVTATEKIATNVARSVSRATLSPTIDNSEQDSDDDESNAQSECVVKVKLWQTADRPISVLLTPLESSGMSTPLDSTVFRRSPWEAGIGA